MAIQLASIMSTEGQKMMRQLCIALGIDPEETRRIILDFNVAFPAIQVYVEKYASTAIFDVDWARGMKEATIELKDNAHGGP